MEELSGGLWTWSGRHPAWNEGDEWGPDVRSYALDSDGVLVLIDPVTPPQELVRGRDVVVALTAPWHGRNATDIGAPIHIEDDKPLPPGVNAQPAFFPGERSLWIPNHNALVVGDSLYLGKAVSDDWLGERTREEYNEKLRPLLDLPIEMLLPTHGDPILDDAHGKLERELS